MGNDFCSCSCLNDITKPETEDLSRDNKSAITGKKIDNNPKIIFNNNNNITYKSFDSIDPLLSQREKESKSTTTLSSHYKRNSIKSLKNANGKQKKKNLEKIILLKNNLINDNKNNINNSKYNNIKPNLENKSPVKKIKKEELVSYNFKHYFNTLQGQEMTLNINDNNNKLCITLHKYFLKLITKKEFNKNIECYIEEEQQLYKKCIDIIYTQNKLLKQAELNSIIKYSQDGYLKYYNEEKDILNMKFVNPKESFNNCIVIKYSENNSSSLDNMLWIYKGQVNRAGEPHGFGEKISKNGVKQKGYWKNGEMFGWCEIIDNQGDIYMGPFYNNKGITGKGEKYTLKKKSLYKGEFLRGEKHGYGEENSNEGQFVGNFQKNKKNGKGKMIYKISGDIYEGEYKDDLFDGQGHYIWKTNGQEYQGEYKEGLMHGKGLFEWSDGEYYRGNFVNGKKEGEGELHMGNGRSFIGPFKDGRPNGIGIYDNGINFKGEMEFIDGKMNIKYIKGKESNSSFDTVNDNDNNDKDSQSFK